jgi:hypothetical protein
MRAFALITSLCLLCGMAEADFEIKDPALPVEDETISPASSEIVDYTVEGAGVKSCAVFNRESKKGSSMHYINLNWAKGFISGVNYIHAETRGNSHLGKGLDLESLTLWINNYCQDHPANTLSDASAALIEELIR